MEVVCEVINVSGLLPVQQATAERVVSALILGLCDIRVEIHKEYVRWEWDSSRFAANLGKMCSDRTYLFTEA